MNDSCFICQKHLGLVAPPPGGYLYQDDDWLVCHAPATMGALGTLIVESRRHVLDFATMTDAEVAGYGLLLRRLYRALKETTTAERVYTVVLLEGVAHFHTWLVPRLSDSTERGVALLASNASCDEAEAVALVGRLRVLLG
jgi:diadenosine tetraphosphate (Ap4A) HIT family hydrolase